MEKSISNRYYFDYNATSPLSNKVIDFIKGGDFLFGNPAAQHTTGKNAKKYINETKEFLYHFFNLSENHFELIFHSGATEGINNYFKGNALKDFSLNKKSLFVFSTIDHQASISLGEDIKILGHDLLYFEVDKNGQFDLQKLIEEINKVKSNYAQVYLNFTYVNSETGVVWDLTSALQIKKETGAIIFVDAVQSVGKIFNYEKLNNELDAYVFSGHKFGAMKGVGLTFLKKNSPYKNLMTGGEQQNGLRSGTENALGIYSIKLALMDYRENFDAKNLEAYKAKIESELINSNDKISIVAKDFKRSLNTIFFITRGLRSDNLSMKFDLNLMDVSVGSACSSGVAKENRALISMGYSKDESLSCIRLSFNPLLKEDELGNIIHKIKSVISSV